LRLLRYNEQAMAQVFYRKWRPQVLGDVVGQDSITRTLLNALSTGHISHAYLFCGPRGTGKTSTARILAKAINCLNNGRGEPCNDCAMCQAITEARALDVIEIDAASNTSVDDIRGLREKVNYAPSQARYKVYIIDEVHMLSNSAANALLKTLEEPPPHVIFILATTEVHKILATIMSRCQRFDFRRHSQGNVAMELARVCRGESIKMDAEAMRLVARSATGSMRDALNLLEQLTTFYGSEVGLAQAQAALGISGDQRVKDLAGHIVNGNIPAGIATINSVNNDGMDLRQFNRELVEYLRALLLAKTNAGDSIGLTVEDMAEVKALAAKTTLDRIVTATKLFGQLGPRFDNYSTLPLELALVDSVVHADKAPSAQAAESRASQVAGPAAAAPGAPHASGPVSRPVAEPGSQPAASAPGWDAMKTGPAAPVGTQSKGPSTSAPPRAVPGAASPQSKPAKAGVPAGASATVAVAADSSLAGTPMEVTSEIERLKLNWKVIIKQAPADVQKHPALGVLRSAPVKLISIEGNIVCLAFGTKIFKDMIEKLENQKVTERVISDFLGRPCQIRCVLEENLQVKEDNHLVKEALRMGAQIVEEKK
jgi:DNA polymerase III subunit gamma/tau